MTQESGLTPSRVEVIEATEEQEPVLANLLELYIHDFSEFLNLDIGENGRFGYPSLALYWSEAGRHPFLIRADSTLAGFALVKRGPEVFGRESVWDMAEFFVLRGFRRRSIGTLAAHQVWRSLAGLWEVRVMQRNSLAQRFWRNSVSTFAGKQIHPRRIEQNGEPWDVFSFQSRGTVVADPLSEDL